MTIRRGLRKIGFESFFPYILHETLSTAYNRNATSVASTEETGLRKF